MKNVLRCRACNCRTLVLWVRPFCVCVPAHIRENLPQTDSHFDWPCFVHHAGTLNVIYFFLNISFFIVVEKTWSMNSSRKECNFYRSNYRWELNLERTHQPCLQNITHFLPVLCCLASIDSLKNSRKIQLRIISNPNFHNLKWLKKNRYKEANINDYYSQSWWEGCLKSHMFPPLRFLSNLQVKGEMSKYLWTSFGSLVCWRLKTSNLLVVIVFIQIHNYFSVIHVVSIRSFMIFNN